MKRLRFEWDEEKAKINIGKHGISFPEAATAFLDGGGLVIDDVDHSEKEERYVLIGCSARGRMIVVCYCVKEEDDETIVRIISARKATKTELSHYRRWGKEA